eukprot:2769460-Alexandrium_andersonii.AAC.1
MFQSRQGTKPGDPYGDFLFNVSAKHVAMQVREEFQKHGIQLVLPPSHNPVLAKYDDVQARSDCE